MSRSDGSPRAPAGRPRSAAAGARGPAWRAAARGEIAAVCIALVCLAGPWGCSAGAAPALDARAAADRAPCPVSASDAAWIQRTLDAWETAASTFLLLDPEPLPWVLLFDERCVWHLEPDPRHVPEARPIATSLRFASRPVPVAGAPHGDIIRLPNGARVPATTMASASLYRRGEATFFAVALPGLWRAEPRAAKDPDLDARILGVVSHEIVHTRQLIAVSRRITELQREYPLPAALDDNLVEERFGDDDAFREAFEEERDLFYQAAREETVRARELAALGLTMVHRRRARWFAGSEVPFAELEDLFLMMEGVAEWCRFKLLQHDPATARPEAEALAFVRGTDNDWSQDEGLALYLLLDRIAPGWQARTFGSDPAPPLALLAEAVSAQEMPAGPAR